MTYFFKKDKLKPKTAEQREAEFLESMKRIKELEGKPLQVFDGPLDEPEMTKEMREKLYQEFLEEVRKIIKETEKNEIIFQEKHQI